MSAKTIHNLVDDNCIFAGGRAAGSSIHMNIQRLVARIRSAAGKFEDLIGRDVAVV